MERQIDLDQLLLRFADLLARCAGEAAMPDELAIAIASALATQGANVLADGGRGGLVALFRAIRNRFRPGSPESVALEAASEDPADESNTNELADALTRHMADDPEFAEQVRVLWRNASNGSVPDHGGVVNNFSGSAERVVQARDIRGDINF